MPLPSPLPAPGVYKPAAWMSAEAQDLLSRMLCLDPEQRITLEAVWAHPWVAGAPRWEPPGVGAGRLYRCLTDPTTGAVLPDEAGGWRCLLCVQAAVPCGACSLQSWRLPGAWPCCSSLASLLSCHAGTSSQPTSPYPPLPAPPSAAVMAQLEALGADTAAIRRALRSRECNSLTASYHLQLEAHLEAQRAAASREREAAAERAAAKRLAEQQRGASCSADWQWDFAAISAHAAAAERCQAAAAAGSQAAAGGSGAPLSPTAAAAGSGGLRGSGSPARLRLAVAPPAGSPTRFGVAAAGYVSSPRRPATSGAATPTLHFGGTPFSSPPLAQAPPAAQQPEAVPAMPAAFVSAEARPRPADSEPFTIKALHAPPGSGEPSVSTPVAAAAAAAELAATPALITAAAAVTTTTAVVEGEGPTSPSKSPRLAPLPGGRCG